MKFREYIRQIEEKPLHAQFWRANEEVCRTKFWACSKEGD